MTDPCVTVITPAYNRADYLPETLDSVLSQAYPNLDYLVLDDGSTDNTCEVLARYEGRLRWESHANMGEARTVNRGFAMAEGDLVAVVNSDDPVLPGWLAAMVETLQRHPAALGAYPDWYKIDAQSQRFGAVYQRDYDYATMLRECICLIGPGAVIRRSAIERYGGRNPDYRYVGDFDFWLRLGLHGDFVRVPQPLATHRVHPDSATVAQRGKLMGDEHIRMIDSVFAQPDLPAAIRALESASRSRAHYMAAALTLGQSYAEARAAFRRSFQLYPATYLTDPKRLAYLLSTLLPENMHRRLWTIWKSG